jgi:preprotein translocase subunit SecG
MQLVLIVILLFVTLALIGVILIQKSEGGTNALTSSGGVGGVMSSRSASNLLTRMTSILAAVFMGLCLVLAIVSRHHQTGADDASLTNIKPAQEVSSSSSSDDL